MIFRMFAAALAAGLLAAILITGLQSIITTPMILQAEVYEAADTSHDHGTTDNAQHETDWMPEQGMERLFYTFLANCGAGVGFALLLIVGMSFNLGALGGGRGVMWGIGGFAAFTLAPALGLPPGVPGLAVPDEQIAQVWWVMTTVLSGVGLAAMVFGKSYVLKFLGMVLLVLPHVLGAPVGSGESQVPAELAARFSASSIVLSAIFWVMIGYFSGLLFWRIGEKFRDT
jgi:cobalt transporter subunit CbtA